MNLFTIAILRFRLKNEQKMIVTLQVIMEYMIKFCSSYHLLIGKYLRKYSNISYEILP